MQLTCAGRLWGSGDRWQRASKIVVLKSAYLNIHVVRPLWKYQLVWCNEQIFCLTQLEFGLNVTPKIMSAILKAVLKKMTQDNRWHTDNRWHLSWWNYSAHVKPCQSSQLIWLELLGAALSLRLDKDGAGHLVFTKGNEILEQPEEMSRRKLFSACCKPVGHYPIARWLRTTCSYMKRWRNWLERPGG